MRESKSYCEATQKLLIIKKQKNLLRVKPKVGYCKGTDPSKDHGEFCMEICEGIQKYCGITQNVMRGNPKVMQKYCVEM